MKKILLTGAVLFSSSIGLIAQSSIMLSQITPSTATSASVALAIPNGKIIYRSVDAGTDDGAFASGVEFILKNTSTSTKSYKMERFDDIVNTISVSDVGSPSFCFVTCFAPFVMVSPKAATLTPNQNFDLSVHYTEASAKGLSKIRYQIYDVNTPSDVFEFTVKYNDPTASIETNSSLFSYVSSISPNPCSSKASLNVNTLSEVNNASISITNALGAVVSVKNIDLTIGKNTIDIDSQNLSDGLYFVTIIANSSKITKKFIINK